MQFDNIFQQQNSNHAKYSILSVIRHLIIRQLQSFITFISWKHQINK